MIIVSFADSQSLFIFRRSRQWKSREKYVIKSLLSIVNSSFSRGALNLLVTKHEEYFFKFTIHNKWNPLTTPHENTPVRPSSKTDMLYRLQSPSWLNTRIRIHFSTTKIPGRYSLTLALEVLVSKRVRNRRTRHGTPHHEFPELPSPTPFRKQNLPILWTWPGPASCPAQLIISGIYGKWKNL